MLIAILAYVTPVEKVEGFESGFLLAVDVTLSASRVSTYFSPQWQTVLSSHQAIPVKIWHFAQSDDCWLVVLVMPINHFGPRLSFSSIAFH